MNAVSRVRQLPLSVGRDDGTVHEVILYHVLPPTDVRPNSINDAFLVRVAGVVFEI